MAGITDVGRKTVRLKWDWVGHVSRMHLEDIKMFGYSNKLAVSEQSKTSRSSSQTMAR